MAPEDERLYILLDRYLTGEASSTDVQAVREWLAQDSDHGRLLDDLRLIRRAAAGRAPKSSTDVAWAKAVDALGVAPQPRVSRRLLVGALAAAAVVVALIGGSGLLRRAPRWSEKATTAAQRLGGRLPGGTPVTIAPLRPVRHTGHYRTPRRL